jgi:hypothetical protein
MRRSRRPGLHSARLMAADGKPRPLVLLPAWPKTDLVEPYQVVAH